MKRLIAAAVVGLAVLALVGGPATAKSKMQMVDGSIALPAPYTDDSGCFAGVHRRLQAVAQGQANGIVGYNFAVDKATWGKPFTLKVTGGQGAVDLDINYYLGPLTKITDFVDQGGDPTPPATVAYEARKPGGEKGAVPKGAENAIVCMYGGGQGAGFGATFHYMAGGM